MRYNYKNWTTEEDLKLESLLKENKYSFKEIGEQLNRSHSSCRGRAHLIGFNNRLYVKKTHSHDEDFWKKNSPISFYWAGFASADANVYQRGKTSGVFRMELSTLDEQHLETFKKQCGYTGEIRKYHRENRPTGTAKISISSSSWLEDLKNNFGIVPNKTKTMVPPIFLSEQLSFCWLIGLIDGDGTIFFNVKENFLTIKVTSCNENILNSAKTIIQNILSKRGILFEPNIKELNYANCSILTLSGTKAAVLIDFLKDVDVPRLKRKWEQEKVLNRVSFCKSKYPQYFSQENQYNNNMKHKLETNGRENDGRPMLLEQVWGKTDMSRYQTLDEAEYTNTISNMTRADLEAHARKMGVNVCEGSLRLRDMLLNEFRSYCSMLSVPKSTLPSKKDFSPEALKVMNEGR